MVRAIHAINLEVPSMDDPNFDAEGFEQLVWQRILAEYEQKYRTTDGADEVQRDITKHEKY